MSEAEYRRRLVEHNAACVELLEAASPRVREFVRTWYQLDLYPLDWIRQRIAALEELAAPLPASAALQDLKESHMFRFDEPWSVQQLSIEDFLVGMSLLGTPQEIQMVGSFASANDSSVRTAHRDVDLPFHRDGIYTKALADMQAGMYVEKPNVDIVGMYCVRANEEPCYTTISEDGVTLLTEVNLRAGEALIMDNRLWHGRRGPVGKRLLIRFWTTRERK